MNAPGVVGESVERECDTFTRYLTGQRPTPYVVEKYRHAHTVRSELAEPQRRQRRLVELAERSPSWASLADAYAALFLPRSLLRQKLVLLLAILETAPPTAECGVAGRRRLATVGLLVATTILAAARLAVAVLVVPPLLLLGRSRGRRD